MFLYFLKGLKVSKKWGHKNINPQRKSLLKNLKKQLKIWFIPSNILNLALTHSSVVYSKNKLSSNERLEFIGDSVLNLVVSEFLFKSFPNLTEGELSIIRSEVVDKKSLHSVAEKWNLKEYLLVSKEVMMNPRAMYKALANAVEAIIGALYLCTSYGYTKKFVLRYFSEIIMERIKEGPKDYKSTLQILTLKELGEYPIYEVLGELGPQHQKTFIVGVRLRGEIIADGQGWTKKEAEQEAAKHAINYLLQNLPKVKSLKEKKHIESEYEEEY